MLPALKAFTTTWRARQDSEPLSRHTLCELNSTVRCLKGRRKNWFCRTRLSAIAVGLAGSNGSNDPLYNSINPMSTNEEPKEQSSMSKPSFQSIDPSASGEDITVVSTYLWTNPSFLTTFWSCALPTAVTNLTPPW